MEIIYDAYILRDVIGKLSSLENYEPIGEIRLNGKAIEGGGVTLKHNITLDFYSVIHIDNKSYPNKIFLNRLGSANIQ